MYNVHLRSNHSANFDTGIHSPSKNRNFIVLVANKRHRDDPIAGVSDPIARYILSWFQTMSNMLTLFWSKDT